MSTWLNSLVSNTFPLYRFQLFNPDTNETLTLKTEPLEWASGTLEYNRRIEVGGVFANFIVESLTFIDEGADFLRTIWETKEMNGNCDLRISWFKKTTRSYVDFPSNYSLNFTKIKPNVKIGKNAIGLNIATKNSSELTKFDNRKKTNVDVTKTTTIGGETVIDYPALKKNFNMPAFDINVLSKWIDTYTGQKIINNNGAEIIFTTFQMDITDSDYAETTAVAYQTDILISSVPGITDFFSPSLEDRNVDFIYDITVEVLNRKGGFLNAQDVYHIYLEELNLGGIVNQYTIANFGRTKGVKNYANTLSIPIATGNRLRVYIKTDSTENIDADIITSTFQIKESVSSSDAKTVEGFPIYETFERVLQHILGTQFPFYSEFFGRLDTPYNLDGDFYLSENQLRFASIFSGLNLRGAILLDPDNPLAISFDKLFKSSNAWYNLGYTTETIDNFNRIRIEEYSYFFEDVEILDISDRITRLDIVTEAIPELAYLNIKSGYKDSNPEVFNGRGEYNTLNERTSIINTDKTFDNVSDIRGDTIEIIAKLADELTTEDTKEDNSLFVVKSQRDGDEWQPEFDTNIVIEDNSSLFGDQSMNRYITPTRCLKRNGNK